MKIFPIRYEIRGITLNADELNNICEYYKAACTAEYIYDNYELTEEAALKYGYKIREEMSKHDLCEDEAIAKVCRGVKTRIQHGKCPFDGDEVNDCEDCVYSIDYHYVNGECLPRVGD